MLQMEIRPEGLDDLPRPESGAVLGLRQGPH